MVKNSISSNFDAVALTKALNQFQSFYEATLQNNILTIKSALNNFVQNNQLTHLSAESSATKFYSIAFLPRQNF